MVSRRSRSPNLIYVNSTPLSNQVGLLACTKMTAIRLTVIDDNRAGSAPGPQCVQAALGMLRLKHAKDHLELAARDHQWRPEHTGRHLR